MEPVPRYSLIKRLQRGLPRGCPVDLSDLAKLGVSPETAARQARDGWLDRLGQGVYILPGDVPTAHASVRLLQRRVAGLHIGGKSALALQGVRQNLVFRETLTLWGAERATLPRWFSARFAARYSSAALFEFPNEDLVDQTIFTPPGTLAGLRVSTQERAALELLYDAGTGESLEEAQLLFGQLRNLRRQVVGELLSCCTSVKAVRLFLAWARETGVVDVDVLQREFPLRVGSSSRWVGTLSDGTRLTLQPYG